MGSADVGGAIASASQQAETLTDVVVRIAGKARRDEA
jgi:hypothetical protein